MLPVTVKLFSVMKATIPGAGEYWGNALGNTGEPGGILGRMGCREPPEG